MLRPIDPLELLRRRDKHVLGAGEGILFDPPHPLWLDRPGFWDGGHVFRYPIAPLFTVTFVEPSGKELPLRRMHRDWTPAEIVTGYVGGGLELEERRVVLAGGRFVSEWRVTNGMANPAELTIVAWTAQESAVVTAREGARGGPEGVTFARTAQLGNGERAEIALVCTLRFEHEAPEGWALYEVDATPEAVPPEWMLTPFRERWRGPTLRDERVLASGAGTERRLLFAGVSRKLRLGAGEADSFGASLQALPAAPELRPPSAAAPPIGNAAAQSRTVWQQHFAAAPALGSSDPFLERAFVHRWFALRLVSVPPVGHFTAAGVVEGPGYLHRAGAAAACDAVRDLRWLADPARARGTFKMFLDAQDEGGRLPAWIAADHAGGYGLAVADWGGALLALEETHPDVAFLSEAYMVLSRAAEAADRERDPEASGLLDARARGEGLRAPGGGERFDALAAGVLEPGVRLKGVDVTVWHYRLRRALAEAARRLGRSEDAAEHDALAHRTREAIRFRLWHRQSAIFSEAPADTLAATGARSAAGFLPFLTDIAGPEHLPAIERHLLDPRAFWTAHPVPISPDGPKDGSAFWSSPAANSAVADALARTAIELEPRLRGRAAELLQRTVRLQFFDGDPGRPNAYDAYRSDTGWPAARRGRDDCARGCPNDLIVRYVAGVRPAATGVIVDPLPCGVERLRLERLPCRGRRLGVTLTGPRIKVSVDGREAGEGVIGTPLEVPLEVSPALARTPA